MKNLIKKYIGIAGFLTALPLICISGYYKYHNNVELDLVGDLGIIIWITTMVLSYELNKEKPRNWFIILVLITFLVTIFFNFI